MMNIPSVKCHECESWASALVGGRWYCFRHLKAHSERSEAEIAKLQSQIDALSSYIAEAAGDESVLLPVNTLNAIGVRSEAALRECDAWKRRCRLLTDPEYGRWQEALQEARAALSTEPDPPPPRRWPLSVCQKCGRAASFGFNVADHQWNCGGEFREVEVVALGDVLVALDPGASK